MSGDDRNGHEAPLFPKVYADIETSRLLDVYARGPERLRRALDGLSDDALHARPIAGKWSVVEIAVHMADSEMVGAVRIRMVLAAAGEPALPGYDQERWSDAPCSARRSSCRRCCPSGCIERAPFDLRRPPGSATIPLTPSIRPRVQEAWP